ncbi:MAG: hypothetical protein U0T77_08405 [Chitinophagales bacterium]
MKTIFALTICLFTGTFLFAQNKQYKVVVAGFYNLENFYDTINQPNVDDEDFTPTGSYHYTGSIFLDKVDHLAEAISPNRTDVSPGRTRLFRMQK